MNNFHGDKPWDYGAILFTNDVTFKPSPSLAVFPWRPERSRQELISIANIATEATYLAIGRPITQAEDPAIAWQRILDELS
ncbi:MAG: hypothetical protein AAGA67_06640 [Cyanobacteria bacterium P01_F01_bin.153]